MPTTEQEKTERRAAMKRLRAERKDRIEAAAARLKKQRKAVQAIKEGLQHGGKTVPQLSEETGFPASETFWYLMALKKYGEVTEETKAGGYFQYGLINGTPGETPGTGEDTAGS